MKRLAEFKDEAWLCNHCSMCSDTVCDEAGFYRTCPVYRQLRFDDNSARGHNTVALYLLQGSLEYGKDVADCVFKCTTCSTCMEICQPAGNVSALMGGTDFKTLLIEAAGPLGVPLEGVQSVNIIKAMRADCFDLGVAPEPVLEMAKSAEENGNPYGYAHADRMNWAKGQNLKTNGETVLFAGCRQAYMSPEIATLAAKILKNAGADISILSDEKCCGACMFGVGAVETGKKLLQHNYDLLKKNKVKTVISLCGDGYKSMVKDWPQILGEPLPFKVVHISQYLSDLIAGDRIKFKNTIDKTITYHDPCHLGRGMKVYNEPRQVLTSIPGINLVEMYPTKHASWCCGAGGGIKVTFPDLALAIGAEKVRLAKETGVDALVTSCSYCKTNFKDVIEKEKINIELIDMIELVAQAMEV